MYASSVTMYHNSPIYNEWITKRISSFSIVVNVTILFLFCWGLLNCFLSRFCSAYPSDTDFLERPSCVIRPSTENTGKIGKWNTNFKRCKTALLSFLSRQNENVSWIDPEVKCMTHFFLQKKELCHRKINTRDVFCRSFFCFPSSQIENKVSVLLEGRHFLWKP